MNQSTDHDIYWGFNEFGNINRTSLLDTIYWPLWEQVLGITYYSLLSVTGIIGNVFILYAVGKVKKRCHDKRTLLIITYLAFIDLFSSLLLYPNFILLVYTKRYVFDASYCKLLGIWEVYFPTTSTFLVLTMVAAKVDVLRNPFSSLSENNNKMHVICLLVCFAGLLIPSAPFFNLATYIYDPKRATCTFDFYPEVNHLAKFIFVTGATCFCCVGPLLAIAVLSYYIIRKVKRSSGSRIRKTVNQNPKTSLKSVMVVLLVVLAYAITWAAFFIVFSVAFFYRTERIIPRSLLFWPKASLMTNNVVNPFVYLYSNVHIYNLLIKIVPDWIGKRKKSVQNVQKMEELSARTRSSSIFIDIAHVYRNISTRLQTSLNEHNLRRES